MAQTQNGENTGCESEECPPLLVGNSIFSIRKWNDGTGTFINKPFYSKQGNLALFLCNKSTLYLHLNLHSVIHYFLITYLYLDTW